MNPLFCMGKPKPLYFSQEEAAQESSSDSHLWSSSVLLTPESENEEEKMKKALKKKNEERFRLWRKKQNLKRKLAEIKKQEQKIRGEKELDAFSCRLMGDIIILRQSVAEIKSSVDNIRDFIIAEKAVLDLRKTSEIDTILNLDMNKLD